LRLEKKTSQEIFIFSNQSDHIAYVGFPKNQSTKLNYLIFSSRIIRRVKTEKVSIFLKIFFQKLKKREIVRIYAVFLSLA